MKIYVGNLSKDITDPQLKNLALPFGEPDSANIARELPSGQSKGFGFIEYASADAARAAIAGLHGKEVRGQTLNVFESNALKERNWTPRP